MLTVLVDPWFKKQFFDAQNYNNLYPNSVTKAVCALKQLVAEKGLNAAVLHTNNNFAMLDPDLLDMVNDIFQPVSMQQVAQDDEVDRFFLLSKEDKDADPLACWKLHKFQFAALSQVACDLLSIPAVGRTARQYNAQSLQRQRL